MSERPAAGLVLAERYELTAHLEPGELSDVWKARRLKDDGVVAVKILKPELAENAAALARFTREIRVLAGFRHPNLLRVLAIGRTAEGAPYIVTEYREGRLLSEDVSALTLTVDQACHVAAQIARVLAAAHRRGIVHRGLNPDKILLCHHEGDALAAKVLDFGLAHLTAASGEEMLTRHGERLGRYEYLAPEYIRDGQLDARSDLYVLGILLFEMLTGQPPFVGRGPDILQKHLSEAPWAPSDLCEQEVPEWLDQLVLALLAKEPAERPEDAMTVARAFAKQVWPA